MPALLQMHLLCVIVQQCEMLSTISVVKHVRFGLYAFRGLANPCS